MFKHSQAMNKKQKFSSLLLFFNKTNQSDETKIESCVFFINFAVKNETIRILLSSDSN